MLSWRNNLRPASFRGIPFKVEKTSTGVGRRTEIHHYPVSSTKKGGAFQDFVWSKDLGGEADEFTIEGYVIQTLENGYNYMPGRDKLMKALKTQGPGILIHPFYTLPLRVSVKGKATVEESITKDGGMAKFTMTFVQYDRPIFGQLEEDFIGLVDGGVLGMVNATLDTVAGVFQTGASFISSVVGPVFAVMSKVQNVLAVAKGALFSTISLAVSLVTTAKNLIETIIGTPCAIGNILKTGADSLLEVTGMTGTVIEGATIGKCSGATRGEDIRLDGITITEELGVSLVEGIAKESNITTSNLISRARTGKSVSERALAGESISESNFLIDMTQIENVESDEDVSDYSSGVIGSVPQDQSENLDLIVVANQSFMLGNAARIAIRTDFSSQDQMENALNSVAEALDRLLDRIGSLSDDMDDPILFHYTSLMRAQFVSAMYGKFSGLAKELDYEIPSGVTSSLELAYDIYGDIGRNKELFLRNKNIVNHPGFFPNGEEVKVLSE